MSLDSTKNREPSRYHFGEGCHAPLSNSQAAAQDLGGVCEGDRTARADGVSRETFRGASVTQPAGQGGEPTETVRTVGGVGVLRSSEDLPERKTGGERRRGAWVRVKGTSNGTGDGQGDLDINSAKSLRRCKAHCDGGRKPSRGSTLGKPDAGKPLVRFDEGRSETVIGLAPLQPVRSAYSTNFLANCSGGLRPPIATFRIRKTRFRPRGVGNASLHGKELYFRQPASGCHHTEMFCVYCWQVLNRASRVS